MPWFNAKTTTKTDVNVPAYDPLGTGGPSDHSRGAAEIHFCRPEPADRLYNVIACCLDTENAFVA